MIAIREEIRAIEEGQLAARGQPAQERAAHRRGRASPTSGRTRTRASRPRSRRRGRATTSSGRPSAASTTRSAIATSSARARRSRPTPRPERTLGGVSEHSPAEPCLQPDVTGLMMHFFIAASSGQIQHWLFILQISFGTLCRRRRRSRRRRSPCTRARQDDDDVSAARVVTRTFESCAQLSARAPVRSLAVTRLAHLQRDDVGSRTQFDLRLFVRADEALVVDLARELRALLARRREDAARARGTTDGFASHVSLMPDRGRRRS